MEQEGGAFTVNALLHSGYVSEEAIEKQPG